MNYTVEGKSHTKLLVFINGAGLCKWMWRFQKSLSEKYKCIFFDLPGHGDNIKFKFTTINEISANLLEIIRNESNEKKAVIIGHSIGAQIALNILKIHSEYISKAVIISALNNPTKLTPFFIKPMISISMPLVKQKWFSSFQAKEISLPEEWFENYYNDSIKISKETLLNITKENMAFDFSKKISEIPVLILAGKNEKDIIKKSSAKTADYIKDSKYYILKNSGHGIPYEQHELFNKLLINFIDE